MATAETIPQLSSTVTWRDTVARWRFRWGIGRMNARVVPGLYRIGEPTRDAPVLVTCNYRMTVDLLRRDLADLDVWVLVLETYGINVWCAAGKKTFGTDELVRRIFSANLVDHVAHETLVLPQLGAVGVAAHEVRRATGYRVVWGPVRSADLPEFLRSGMKATPEMRAVTFTMPERLALAPMEFVPSLRYGLWAVPVLATLAVLGTSIRAHTFAWEAGVLSLFPAIVLPLVGALAGAVAVPALLPWLPGRAFTVKGSVAGVVLALAALAALPGMLGLMSPWGWTGAVLMVAAVAAYIAVNFTGSTPYTSPSGVESELRRGLPVAGAALAVGLGCWTIAWATKVGPLLLGR